MNNTRRLTLFAAVTVIVSVAVAGTVLAAPDKGPKSEPPGWNRGEKEGWKGNDVPPGLAKKEGKLPPGLTKEEQAEWKDGRPPGWSRGEKEGWNGKDVPPGLEKKGGQLPPGLAKKTPPGYEKWNDKKKKDWDNDLDNAKEQVRGKAKKLKDFSEEDLDSATGSIEAAARRGVPINAARDLTEKAMDQGERGKDIETATRALTYGVDKETDFDQLGKFVNEKLDQGLRGDDLSTEIYNEIARRHEERLKAREAEQQEKAQDKDPGKQNTADAKETPQQNKAKGNDKQD